MKRPTPDSSGDGSRTVVVTGASAGVGRATVRAFASEGWNVGLLARDPDRLDQAKREVEAAGGRAIAIQTDVAEPEQVRRAGRKVEEALGPIDVWVNNAMVTVLSPFEEIEPDEFERVTQVTYLGTVNGTRVALDRMKARDRGTIVQVGSALAYRSIPLQSAYCGAKSAIRGFTDSLRCELRHRGSDIRLTMVQLPAVNTPQFEWCRTHLEGAPQPVPPIFEPEVAARAIVRAAEDPRREFYVGTTAALSIYAQRVAPGLLDRYLARTGYEAQILRGSETNGVTASRIDNLFEPVEGDYAAHGRFDDRSHDHSPQLQLSLHRGWIAAAIGATTAGLVALALTRP